ncbi:MAG: YaeQ family protein, partial [Nevskia sp.]|nr:YaeQ family protein [Nevskia sp.]
VLVRDLTGRVTTWIEVGAPDAERLHRGSKLAGRAAVYTHRDPGNLLAQLAGRKIHRAEAIPLYSFGRGFVEAAAKAIDRRNALTLSVTERQLYLDINGNSFSAAIEEQRLG